MSITATQDTLFPLPEATEPARFSSAVDRYRYVMDLQDEHGGLLPQNLVPDLLGLTPARVSQLISDQRFQVVMVFGKRFITAPSIAEFMAQERKTGVHIKQPGAVKLAAACYSTAKNLMKD